MNGTGPAAGRVWVSGAALFVLFTAVVGATQRAPVRFLAIDTTGGLLFVAAGALAWKRRPEVRTGPLLVASAVLWSVGSYAPTSLVPWSLLGFAFERYYDLVLAFLILSFPDIRLGRTARVVLATMAGAYVVRTASRLLVDCGCTGTEHPFAVVEDLDLFEAIQVWTSVVIVFAGVAVAVLAVHRLARASPPARRILWPVVAAGCIAGLIAAYDAAELAVFAQWGTVLLSFGEPWREVVAWTIIAAVALIPVGFLVGVLRLRMRQGSIGRMALQLRQGADPQRLQEALRHALGDPHLDLYLRDRNGTWTTASRDRVEALPEAEEKAVTVLSGGEEPIAAVAHDPTLREDPGLVAAATAVLRLAVENERLTDVVRAQLEDVRASRARLVQAAEQERRRIVRDLHDGAQQRLISVGLHLNQVREQARQAEPGAPFVHRLDDAVDELMRGVEELRELARGIQPAILTEAGLHPAVAGLARRSGVPVELDIRLSERLAPDVEAAAYFIVAEALTNVTRHARARTATVHMERDNGRLVVEVSDDG
ncbi:MAG TPA: histidine kinase, partial [Acidimicrobiales bacterium]|nr:histidine kinase [Acidimicrobiales bacterium]